MSLLDACIFAPTLGGTTDWVVSANVPGYQTPASAGAVNGKTYRYRAESADKSQWEIGYGVYTVSTVTLARTTVLYNSSGGTSKINFSTVPNVSVTPIVVDMHKLPKVTVYASGSGTHTYDPLAIWARVSVTGGGGGGGGSGTTSAVNGTAGTNSTFGSLTGVGGSGGIGGSGTGAGGVGGTPTGGDINAPGGAGSNGIALGVTVPGGSGGASLWGGGGQGGNGSSSPTAGSAPGSGGGGGLSTASYAGSGGGGAGGTAIKSLTPGTSDSYAVGAGGGGGGGSSQPGATGATGQIVVEEFYTG